MQGLPKANRAFYRQPGRSIIAQRPEEARQAMNHHLYRVVERLRRPHVTGRQADDQS